MATQLLRSLVNLSDNALGLWFTLILAGFGVGVFARFIYYGRALGIWAFFCHFERFSKRRAITPAPTAECHLHF